MALATVDFKDFIRAGVGMSTPANRLATAINAIITAIGSVPNWGAGVADVAALKAVAAADRADKQSRVCEDNGIGGESIYVFDAQSALDGDDVNVVTPTAGTGRWILAYQGATASIPVINKTGGNIARGTVCYITGFDTTSGKLTVAAADATNAIKQAIGVATAAIANNASGSISSAAKLTTSGLNTGASAVGAPVYYTAAGALSLTPPAAPSPVQIVARVRTLAGSGTLQVQFEAIQPTDAIIGALASLTTTDKTNIVAAVNEVDANADAAQADATTALADAAAAQGDATTAIADALAAQTDIDALRYAQVTIPNGSTTYNAAAPAGWVDAKPVFACISNATTNPVAVMSGAVAAGNLIIALGGCNAGATGDPGATGATIEVWQDGR